MTAVTSGSAKTEQPTHSVGMARMMGLETAATMLGGKDALGDVLGISGRAVRYKLTGERGVSNADLTLAAGALEKLAQRVADHAVKLREVARSRAPLGVGVVI